MVILDDSFYSFVHFFVIFRRTYKARDRLAKMAYKNVYKRTRFHTSTSCFINTDYILHVDRFCKSAALWDIIIRDLLSLLRNNIFIFAEVETVLRLKCSKKFTQIMAYVPVNGVLWPWIK